MESGEVRTGCGCDVMMCPLVPTSPANPRLSCGGVSNLFYILYDLRHDGEYVNGDLNCRDTNYETAERMKGDIR